MVTQKINYTNLDGVKCEQTYAFNLSEQDFVRMSLKYQPSIQACYDKMVKAGDIVGGYDLLTDLIESSYGVREGDSFVKNRVVGGVNSRPDLANFKFHPAFEQFMIDLVTDTDLLLSFFKHITNVPLSEDAFNKLAERVKAEEKKGTVKTKDDKADGTTEDDITDAFDTGLDLLEE